MHLLHPGPGRPLAVDDLFALYDSPAGVRGGMVLSVDGASARGGGSRELQAPGDLDVLRALRAVADVLLVGAGTARAEAYGPVPLGRRARTWRSEHGRAAALPLAVVSRSLDLDPAVLGPDAVVVTCAAAVGRGRFPDVVVAGQDEVDLVSAVRQLSDRGHARVLCEGGPRLLGDLVRAGLLGELCSTVSPLLAGQAPGLLAGGLDVAVPLELVHLLQEGSTLLARWRVSSVCGPPAAGEAPCQSSRWAQTTRLSR